MLYAVEITALRLGQDMKIDILLATMFYALRNACTNLTQQLYIGLTVKSEIVF
jgi:hypothetical protein